MGADGGMNYVDLPRRPSETEMQAIQGLCNEVVRDCLRVTVDTPADARTDTLPEDYDREKGAVRMVAIGELDNDPYALIHLGHEILGILI